MTATLPPDFFARIQTDPFAASPELEARYLDDMDEVCAVAFAADDPVLMVNSALPLKNRRAALKNWRKKQVRDWLQCDDDARRFHDNASADLRESILEGDIPLAGLAEQVAASRQERDARHVAARLESKARLAQSQRAALQDCDGTEHGFTVPGFLAILETGEVGLFRRRHTCVEWARASGGAFLLGNFEQSSFRMHLGPSVD